MTIGNKISVCVAGCLCRPERVDYLKKTVNGIRDHFPDAEYLLAFDNSEADMVVQAAKDYPFAKVYGHREGLGHSWNWGIKNSTRPYILQTEEDWLCAGHWSKDEDHDIDKKIEHLLTVLDRIPLGLIRFDNMATLDGRTYPDGSKAPVYEPGYKPFEVDGVTGKQLYELNKPNPRFWYAGWNPYFMTNRPHLKLRSFHETVGWYMERSNPRIHMRSGVDKHRELVPNTEFDICRQVIQHPGTRMFFYPENTFVHIGHAQAR